MGTITYVASAEGMLRHLDSVACSLRQGGLYAIENYRLDWAAKDPFRPQEWEMEREGIKVKTTYKPILRDALAQTFSEGIVLEVDDNGRETIIRSESENTIIFPQEFQTLIRMNGKFEFIGWYNHETGDPLQRACNSNYVLLRRR